MLLLFDALYINIGLTTVLGILSTIYHLILYGCQHSSMSRRISLPFTIQSYNVHSQKSDICFRSRIVADIFAANIILAQDSIL